MVKTNQPNVNIHLVINQTYNWVYNIFYIALYVLVFKKFDTTVFDRFHY